MHGMIYITFIRLV